MKTKRLLGIVMACMLLFASMSTAFAASNQDVLNALEQGVTLSTGESYYISAQDMQTAKNYLAEEDLSSSELNQIVVCIKGVQEIAKTCDSVAALKNNPEAQKLTLRAADAANVTVAINAGEIVVTDSDGNVLSTITKGSATKVKPDYSSVNGSSKGSAKGSGSTQTSKSAIKQTGADINLTNMIIVMSSTIVMLMGASFVAFKFKLLKD